MRSRGIVVCVCGCGRSFEVTNSGPLRRYYEEKCRRKFKMSERKVYYRNWYVKHRKRVIAKVRQWAASRRDYLTIKDRFRRAANPQPYRDRSARSYQKHRAKKLKYAHGWWAKILSETRKEADQHFRPWENIADQRILEHAVPFRVLARDLGRTYAAITQRAYKLRKGLV